MKNVLLFAAIMIVASCTDNGSKVRVQKIPCDTVYIQKTDTIVIRDTIYTSKNYGNVETLIIN